MAEYIGGGPTLPLHLQLICD